MPRPRVTDTAEGRPAVEDGEVRWYAIRVRTRRERKILCELERQGVATYFPTFEAKRIWSDRKKTVQRPLFPGYIFCHCNLRRGLALVHIAGVLQILGEANQPQAIPDEDIERVRLAVERHLTAPRCRFGVGQPVMVNAGPLTGVIGTVERFRSNSRLVVMVNTRRNALYVEINSDLLCAA